MHIEWPKFKKWAHTLNENNKNRRIAISASSHDRHRCARQRRKLFLSHFVTGDEKWRIHINFKLRK